MLDKNYEKVFVILRRSYYEYAKEALIADNDIDGMVMRLCGMLSTNILTFFSKFVTITVCLIFISLDLTYINKAFNYDPMFDTHREPISLIILAFVILGALLFITAELCYSVLIDRKRSRGLS